MILSTPNKEIELMFNSKKMEKFGDKFAGDTDFILQTKASQSDIRMLNNLITNFATEKTTEDDAYNAIDSLLDDGKKISDIYAMIFRGINERGFFTQHLTVGETPPLNVKLIQQEMMEQMTKSVGSQLVAEQTGALMSEALEHQHTNAG